jgi:hypothetical protein
MRRVSRNILLVPLLAAVGVLGLRGAANAQTCSGSVPLSQRTSFRLEGTVGKGWGPTNAVSMDGRLGVGYGPVFGSVSFSRIQFSDLGYDSDGAGVAVGAEVPLLRRRIMLCPSIGYSRSAAEDLGPMFPSGRIDLVTVSASTQAAVSLGVPLRPGKWFDIVPTLKIGAFWSHSVYGEPVPSSEDPGHVSGGFVQAGVGFVLNRRVGFVAAMSWVPWSSSGLDGGTTFGIGSSVNLGHVK